MNIQSEVPVIHRHHNREGITPWESLTPIEQLIENWFTPKDFHWFKEFHSPPSRNSDDEELTALILDEEHDKHHIFGTGNHEDQYPYFIDVDFEINERGEHLHDIAYYPSKIGDVKEYKSPFFKTFELHFAYEKYNFARLLIPTDTDNNVLFFV